MSQIITSDFLAGVMTGYRAIFQQGLEEAGTEKDNKTYLEIATKFPSTKGSESYNWLGANPTMSEWTDKRKLKAPLPYDYTLKNKHYEATIAVNRDTYEDDSYGVIAPRVRGLAMTAVRHYNEMVMSQLDDGQSLKAFDDGYFFKTNRTIGKSGTIDNLKTGAYSGSTAEIRAALVLAFSTMGAYKTDQGVPMGLKPDTIVCSLGMLVAITAALLPDVAGTTSPYSKVISPDRVFASAWIDDDADNWYVLCTKAEVKPIIFQMRKEVEFVSKDKPDDDGVFWQNEFYYGVDDRFAVGYGDPRCAIKFVDS
jgi:phage major head subunit gpT-like protein